MASKRDMRRADLGKTLQFLTIAPKLTYLLAIPYVDPSKGRDDKGDMASTMASTLPMAAVSPRNLDE